MDSHEATEAGRVRAESYYREHSPLWKTTPSDEELPLIADMMLVYMPGSPEASVFMVAFQKRLKELIRTGGA